MTEFNREERGILLQLARDTIQSCLQKRKKEILGCAREKFQEKRGVFVTLHRLGELRGCIGYPLPIKSLWESVMDNAKSAAFEDPRFPPLTEKEFPEIDIEISILTVPREVEHPENVEVGRDGIIISKGYRRGLLLPQVPVEQGWTRDQFISYGCLKAGLPAEEWMRGVKIETFQAEVFGENDINRS